MDDRKKNNIPECLYPGDPRVCMLLGVQKKPAEDKNIRRSCFVHALYMKGQYLLFHTLTRRILLLEPRYIDCFAGNRSFPSSVLEEEISAKLYEDHFLVPEDEQESRTYLELKDILVLKEDLPKGITNYVILPTTTCNARCFYCFEQGMRYHKMSSETLEDTLRFILEHKPAGEKTIHIHWFGGEPLCAWDNIDCICAGLKDAGIEYTAEMTSNGSLFTEALAKKAAEEWKLDKIQITLDGLAGEYEKRKRYTAALKDPFAAVIRSMHLLRAEGIGVTVRLNVDEENLGETFRVVDFLKNEFSEEEKKRLQVYAHSLFAQQGEGLDACPAYVGSDALEERVLEINDYIHRQGLMPFDPGDLFTFKSNYCMVTAPECNVLIDAEGDLYACDAMPENMHYGDVKAGINLEAWDKVAAPCGVREECTSCVFLPHCTEFDRCPNRTGYDACYRQEKRKLERELRIVYQIYQEQKAQKEKDQRKCE